MTNRSTTATEASDELAEVRRRFAVAITPAMLDLIEPEDPGDPIALQFMPDRRELDASVEEFADPIGDSAHSPVTGIIHRYPDRLLLTPLRICPVYCRFCFRRETVGKQEHALLSDTELEAALHYIETHEEIWEVILSGGDPLILSPRRLGNIMTRLRNIAHVEVIRIHTRVPVVDPDRISTELLTALDIGKAVYIVLHTNHPRELNPATMQAVKKIADAGIPLLSQTVLLKDINDSAATLEQLFRKLVANRVKPYYLHHADKARGTGHFRTSIAAGREIVNSLRGPISGLCQPTYVLDLPGGHGKAPLNQAWASKTEDKSYSVRDYKGARHTYCDSTEDEDQAPIRSLENL